MPVNRKRVQRLIPTGHKCERWALAGMAPGPHTSKPHPQHKVYPYLLRGVDINHPNQVWSTDSIYIQLPRGFVYLVAIIDWYSRTKSRRFRRSSGVVAYPTPWMPVSVSTAWPVPSRIMGCRRFLIPTKARNLPAIALLACCNTIASPSAWTDICSCNICIPHIHVGYGRGRALDNIFVERLWRTVKYEEIYLKKYDSLPDLLIGLTRYFQFYNQERRHQALSYQTPSQVYQTATGGGAMSIDEFNSVKETTIFRAEKLRQRHSAVMSIGLYLKLAEYLSGRRGPLYKP
jgi:putative transposase